MLQFIRRNLGITGLDKTSKGRQFDLGVEHLETRFKEELEFTSNKITIEETPIEIKTEEIDQKIVKNLRQLLNYNQEWICKKHDKGLLKAVAQNGFKFLNQIPGNDKYGFEDISSENITNSLTDEIKKSVLGLDPDQNKTDIIKVILQKRVEEICMIYKE